MDFDFKVILDNIGYLFREGMTFTVTLTLVAGSLGFVLGIGLAVARESRSRIASSLAGLYVDGFRSLPLVLVIFWFFFLVPLVLQWATGAARPVAIGATWSAYITFTMFEAAYFCEIIRTGINGVSRGQAAAGRALGLTERQIFSYVVFPQAIRNASPLILTQLIILFQDTSLVYVLSITDFLGAAGKIAQRDGRLAEMYLFGAVVYFVICFSASSFVRYLEGRRLKTSATKR